MERFIKLSRRLDYVFSAVLALAAVYLLVDHKYFLAAGCALSSAVSYISARAVLARWVLSRVMLARLKS